MSAVTPKENYTGYATAIRDQGTPCARKSQRAPQRDRCFNLRIAPTILSTHRRNSPWGRGPPRPRAGELLVSCCTREGRPSMASNTATPLCASIALEKTERAGALLWLTGDVFIMSPPSIMYFWHAEPQGEWLGIFSLPVLY